MANKTGNLNLTLPLGSDRPDINIMNRNFEIIDAAHEQERKERISDVVDLTAALKTESDRANRRENEVENALNDEVSRAKSAEIANSEAIYNETIRAKKAEKELAQNLSSEVSRAQEAEQENSNAISTEFSRATMKENEISEKLSNEIARAKLADETNANAIGTETTRATAKENEIGRNLESEISRSKSAELELNISISDETKRATKAEQGNARAIAAEITRATQKESVLESGLNEEISRAKGAEQSNADSLITHSSNQSNPHAVTKAQVGLGNVPNVATNDQTPSYTETSALTALINGEKLSVAFGKIAKAVSSLISHLASTNNPHKVTKSQVGLGNVDNTRDTNKPVSIAQQSAIDLAYANSNAYTDKKISELINGAPTTLDTLGEIAAAMAEHEDVVSAIDEAIGTKANQSELDTHTGNNTIHITPSERTSWNDASTKKHTHGNKAIIDRITQALIDNWNAAYTHITDTVKHITETERINWNAAKTHADSAHAPSNAQANVIEAVKVNGATLTPSSKAVNVTVPDKVSQLINDSGYITSTDIDTSQNHTHSNKGILDKITQTMLDKLDGIASGATKVIVDSALSSLSTNPVQNKVINEALDGKANSSHTHTKSHIIDFPSSLPANGGAADYLNANNMVANTDLNNITTPGFYYCQANATVATFKNSPTASAFFMIVGKHAGVYQEIIEYMTASHKRYQRNYYNGTWGNWCRIYTTLDAPTSVTGNSGTATKWANARKINGMSVQGDADRTNYGTCSTPAATAAKTVACTGFALVTGAEITVKFTVTNTASSLTLNVNGTGAKPIYYRGAAISAGYLAANRTYTFRYNGTQYELVGDINTNTTYSTGNASTAGIAKLYQGTGASVDGTMTQKAITSAINSMVEVGSDITV